MYYNWTGPVRIPSSVFFAHKLAYLLGGITERDQDPPKQHQFYTDLPSLYYL